MARMVDVLAGPLGTSEELNGIRIIGNKGMVGKTWTRNILSVLTKGATTGSSLEQAVKTAQLLPLFEQEAINLGADRVSITGNTVVNPAFRNPTAMTLLTRRYGYQFRLINPDTVHLWKDLPTP
jgi:hypothetical protein